MAVYLLNISVDTAEHLPEDLSINDQESFVEIIVEKLLGYEHAIGEFDDHNSEEPGKKETNKIDLLVLFLIQQSDSGNNSYSWKLPYSDHLAFLMQGYYQLDPPPPKV